MIYPLIAWILSNFLGLLLCMFMTGMAYGDYIQILLGPIGESDNILARSHIQLSIMSFFVFLLNFLSAVDVYFDILPQSVRSVADTSGFVGATVMLFAALLLFHLSRLRASTVFRKEQGRSQQG